MKKLALPLALCGLLAVATPALADGGGLPKIASLQVGAHAVSIHGDSPLLHTGANTFTVEVPALTADHTVTLVLSGPSGQTVSVPLKDLTVLSAADDHGGMGGMAGMAGMPDMPGMDHGSAGTSDEEGFDARGKATLPTLGTWTIRVSVAGHGGTESAETQVDVVRGGPNRVYLGFTGLLIAGSITYGVTQRRRQGNGR